MCRSDEQLFSTARKVVTALIARIHTVEWTTAIVQSPAGRATQVGGDLVLWDLPLTFSTSAQKLLMHRHCTCDWWCSGGVQLHLQAAVQRCVYLPYRIHAMHMQHVARYVPTSYHLLGLFFYVTKIWTGLYHHCYGKNAGSIIQSFIACLLVLAAFWAVCGIR